MAGKRENTRKHYATIDQGRLAGGDIAEIDFILRDEIRERKRAEEKLRAVMRGVRCLLFHAIVEEKADGTEDWTIDILDEEAAHRFLPLEIGPGQSYADAWYLSKFDEDRSRCDRNGSLHVRAGRSYSQEFRCRRKDGATRWLAEEVTVEAMSIGFWRVTGVCVDITDRKELEAQLSHRHKLESIGQLAAGIAHEINTPIQYVGDNTRFLKNAFEDLQKLVSVYRELIGKAGEMEPYRIQEHAREAEAAADLDYLMQDVPCSIEQSLDGVGRIAGIVRAMKEFSHPRTGEMRPVDLNHAIESTVTVARNEWKYVAEVVTDFDRDLPLICCLPGDLNQVFLNIIVNAAHAIGAKANRAPEQKGTISITTRQAFDWVEIHIADDGVGIPEENRTKVFDPFFTTKEVGAGTGQGLSVSRMVVVEKHKGTLTVTSELNVGSTFTIRLPISGAASEPIKAA